MSAKSARRKIWGWFFFDWASQPYNTLLLTFIFGPYVKEMLGSGTEAQAAWGFGIGAAGVVMALLGPILGAIADTSGTRIRWIWIFSAMYLVGSAGLWFAAPDNFNLLLTICLFALGLIGMEFATIFTNAMLPDLGTKEEIGRISGDGWAFGYLGGLGALVIFLVFFAEGAETGRTILGLAPAFGLDPEMREGTRFVGPFTALWYLIFMIPFVLFVREPRPVRAAPGAVKAAIIGVGRTIRQLPSQPSLFAYLASSMFYRDALNGIWVFGGIYAAGVLGWSVQDTGLFGITTIVVSALFAWIGGRVDTAFGSKPVITICIVLLTAVAIGIIFVTPTSVFGFAVQEGSSAPTIAFYCLGAVIGAAAGALQSSSRTMLVHQADPTRMTEGFGLYALSGKATSFIAPLSIGIVTSATGSQQLGITPLVVLFLIGLVLMWWVKPEGHPAYRQVGFA
ncbi:MFS transporter [Pseudohalocynthiibacter sp. F2068]|uniref:MFS transporter n=1 Tax=Pseudohalocynthiibacter sp. F2068 TaxID=2926418 RepID=UPI001FF4CE16|nr:MFS transporter [Pseudohalocynthiibacter sp. F2068]MCK0101177.1 MFS transporter [Pseudohalocynthiibacter sp. F2068]